MCLNADIERQFELVQQTWAGSKTFHGLECEVDCFSPRGETERFTIPTERGPICLERLDNFVRVVGGGYFFMPSRRAVDYLAQLSGGDMRVGSEEPVRERAPGPVPALELAGR
jgi:hypothetical protein